MPRVIRLINSGSQKDSNSIHVSAYNRFRSMYEVKTGFIWHIIVYLYYAYASLKVSIIGKIAMNDRYSNVSVQAQFMFNW